ncbi:polyamine ABC transporter substrate-binding protein [Pseudomonas protegens]|uniref:polyamine ABC transporter substrate-binding protein n=1 Tax=Pseudomonas protegens TaxID=380021 RepID=UPI0014735441|nr:polyamine ABC transporter substrate-binding protein [Pseudomonas protegens]MBF0643800.1 polyamine ABC transporter substrate-binding protein [Pseudomonas protegens]NMZ26863.1 polyamine ABC transporter substrate-binding protein [Pseudomonas protegens]NMZ83816.1 polyamine ABC transporter substrate-binding protein [Pseudomonas protegens]
MKSLHTALSRLATACTLGALALAASVTAQAAPERTVNIFNWSEYIAPNIIKDFQAQSGIKVKYDIFESNEVLEAKLLTGNSGYDVVVPSSGFVSKQISAGAFQPLDRGQLPNWKNLDPAVMKLLEQSDPGNRYVIPYMWGTNLIGYNRDKVQELLGSDAPVNSWDLVFKEENLKKLSQCGVTFLDSPTEMLPLALHYLGLDPNSQNPEDYRKAEAMLLKLRPYVRYFHSAKWMGDIANGNICVAVGYSGGFLQAANRANEAKNGVHIEMRIPKEGTLVWIDTVAIPAGAKHVDTAHAFLNYLMEPKVIASISNYVGYPNGVTDSKPFIQQSLLDNPDLFPSAETMTRLYPLAPLPAKAERTRTRTWVKVTSGR